MFLVYIPIGSSRLTYQMFLVSTLIKEPGPERQ